MSQFDELKSLYKQFFNIADEITSMIDRDELNEAMSKIKYKDTLVKKFVLAKKTITIEESQKAEIIKLEEEFIKREKAVIEKLKTMQLEVSQELKKINKNLKVNNAYTVQKEAQGSILDISE